MHHPDEHFDRAHDGLDRAQHRMWHKFQAMGRGGWGFGGPGGFLADGFMRNLDSNGDKELTAAEAEQGFAKLFAKWNTDKSGSLTDEQLRTGLDQDFAPRGMFPR